MYIENDKVYLEVPEVCEVLGLKKSQVYNLGEDDISKRDDPRNQNRNLYEAGAVFEARDDLHRTGSLGDTHFRKIDEESLEQKPKARSAINKMYRSSEYDTGSMGLKKFVHNKGSLNMDSDLSEREFDRRKAMAKERCFGWAKESCDECTKHCDLLEACREERNSRLSDIAKRLEKKAPPEQNEASQEHVDDLSGFQEEAEALKDEIAKDLSNL